MTDATHELKARFSGWWRGAIILGGALLILLGLGAILMPIAATLAALCYLAECCSPPVSSA